MDTKSKNSISQFKIERAQLSFIVGSINSTQDSKNKMLVKLDERWTWEVKIAFLDLKFKELNYALLEFGLFPQCWKRN